MVSKESEEVENSIEVWVKRYSAVVNVNATDVLYSLAGDYVATLYNTNYYSQNVSWNFSIAVTGTILCITAVNII